MTRDLLICILKEIEKKDDEEPTIFQLDGYDPDLVKYHVNLCIEAGWLHGETSRAHAVVESLTMAGQVALLKFREGFTIERVLNG